MSPKHVLAVLTSHEAGWHIAQLARPYDMLTSNGHKVTLCSIVGGNAPVADVSYQDVDCAEFESNAAKMDLCRNTLPLKYFSGQGFDCILLIGGPGAMYDFHQSSDLARVITECYEHDGIIAGAGRGVVGLINVKLSDGSHLIANKDVTGLSNLEEEADCWVPKLPVHGALRTEMLENMIVARGARYSKTEDASVVHVKVDQRLYTAQNSAGVVALSKAVLTALSAEAPVVTTTKRRPSLTSHVQILNTPQIFKEGWMDKMGHSLLSGWTRRWFSMHRRPDGEVVLEYWVNETKLMAEHKGLFVIDEGTDIELETVSGRKHCFRLKNSHGSYLLSAGSVLEMDQWINTIRNRGRQRKGTMTDSGQPLVGGGPMALPKKVNMIFTACALMQCWADHDRISFSSFAAGTIKMTKRAAATASSYDAAGMDAIWDVRAGLGEGNLDQHVCDSFYYPGAHILRSKVHVVHQGSGVEKEVMDATFYFDGSDIKVTKIELASA